MNIKAIVYILGWILNIEGAFMLLPYLVSLIYEEPQGMAFLLVSLLSIVLGTLIVIRKPKNMVFYEKEGFVSAAFSWILMSIFGCLPYIISGEIPKFIDALFEIVSGFTTTGSSILTNVEAMSYCGLFWRSFTHWIGGMGVLVFLLAILPTSGGGSHINIMRAESPGPLVERFLPKVKNTALILYIMYMVLSLLQFLLLIAGKMPVFDAITTVFATAGTGGFAIKNSSLADYSPYIQWITGMFMMLFGVNFNVYFLLYLRKWKKALGYEEMRYYFAIIAVSTLLIALNIYPKSGGVESSLRHAFFQVSSIITTTGFGITDFNLWMSFPKAILVTLMFIGACAGSTGGGIKITRIATLFKTIKKEFMVIIHPGMVKKIKAEGKPVTHEIQRSINVYFVTYVLIFVVSILILSLQNLDLVTTFTAVLATLNNIGPGLEMVGPASNFSCLSTLSKCVLIFDMLAGRLELYPMLVIFNFAMWKTAAVTGVRRLKNKNI